MTRVFKTGGVPFCWHCGRQLVRKKGCFIYGLVKDRDGYEHRVHKDCVENSLGDGVVKVEGGTYLNSSTT